MNDTDPLNIQRDIPYLSIMGSTQHTSISKTTSTCVRRPRPKPRFLSYDNKSSFSPEHIEEKGNLYRCLICPNRGKEWKGRNLMRAHQRNSKTHEKLVALAEKKELKETTQPMPVLYYPPTSPHTSIENAIPVFYDPEVLNSRFDRGDQSSTDGSTNGTDVSPSVKEESPQLDLNAHKINEHRYCIWCRMPEVPMLKYQLCRKFSPEVVKQATRGYLF